MNLWEDYIPLEFELAAGVRKRDAKLKYMLEFALEASKAEIDKILTDYGVPLVQCSRCLDPGHAALARRLYRAAGIRIRTASRTRRRPTRSSPRSSVDNWLAEGADLTQELANAVLAADVERIKFLVKEKGADINARDAQGYAPVQTAARNRHPDLIEALADLGADLNAPDSDGMTPLTACSHAQPRADDQGCSSRARPTSRSRPARLFAARAGDRGSQIRGGGGAARSGRQRQRAGRPDELTPLMVAASQVSPGEGAVFLPGSVRPIDVARDAHQARRRRQRAVEGRRDGADDRGGPQLRSDDRPARAIGRQARRQIRQRARPQPKIAAQNGADAAAKALKLIEKSATLN